ncbi:TPA: hypothetical protein ACH3X2_000714 [Trebouxia sp. C0005]
MRLPTLNRNALRSQQACIEQYWQVDGQDDGATTPTWLKPLPSGHGGLEPNIVRNTSVQARNSKMESRDGRRTCKRGPSPSATPKHSVPHLLNNEPSYAGGGLDGVNTSYAAQHKRQHVGSAIGQDIGVPSSPCSAPDHSRSTLERQAAVVQSAYRRLGPTLHGHTNSSTVSTHQPGLPLARPVRPFGSQSHPHALIPAQHSTPQNQQLKAAIIHHDSLCRNNHLSDMPIYGPSASPSPSLRDAAPAPHLQSRASATTAIVPARQHHKLPQQQQPLPHLDQYQQHQQQQQQPQQTDGMQTPQQQSQGVAEDISKHHLPSLQQQQQAHAYQGLQNLHQQGQPLLDATNHLHPWAGPRGKAQSNSQSLLDSILAGTTGMQVPSAHYTADTIAGASSRQGAATAAVPSKAQEQRAEVHKAEEHKNSGFQSQAGHKKATKALPLQLMLYQWGLPQKVVQAYAAKGVHEMYPWQAAALECGKSGNNLVYCAPTSGGKSLVAEILLIRRLNNTKRPGRPLGGFHMYSKALVVLPYVSVVAEKTEHLTTILAAMRCKVKGYYGSGEGGTPLAPGGESVAVCTIEKANGAINKLVQEGRLGELTCVVVDELHMVCDIHRGLPLELSITKLLFSRYADCIQLIGMSATMGGLQELRSWMRAELFLTNFRPVPLTEHAVFKGCVYSKVNGTSNSDEVLIAMRELPESTVRDQDRLVPLVAEVVMLSEPVLVFCASRKQTQSCAELLSELLPSHPGCEAVAEAAQEARKALVMDMQDAMGGFSNAALEKLMLAGVAYHHAGLTTEERQTIEAGFRSGALLVLTATSTLAAGVNLPARRVILRSLWQGVGPVSRAQYLQMVGRAGRAGQAKLGEAFIMGKGDPEASFGDWKDICQLLVAPVPSLHSQLLSECAFRVCAASTSSVGAATLQHAACQQVTSHQPSQSQTGLSSGSQGIACSASSQPSHAYLASNASQQQQQQPQSQSQTSSTQSVFVHQPGRPSAAVRSSSAQQAAHLLPLQSASSQPNAQSSSSQPGHDDSVSPTQQLQRMLLEAIANGSIGSAQDINHLIQSTLLSHQSQYSRMQLATKTALTALRSQKLLTYSQASPDMPAAWRATTMGRAVYDSGLPTEVGIKLYDQLSKAVAGLVLGEPLHLMYTIMLEHPFKIFGWGYWGKLFENLPSMQKKVACIVGVNEGYIGQRCRGGGAQSDASTKHARFAAACALNALLCEQSAWTVEQTWGLPSSLTQQGVSRGQLQKLQTDLSKWAGMAGLMCASLGWWQLEALLASLSQRAAAGVRPELLRLMDIPSMTAANARALHSAGLVSPELLAAAQDEDVKKALAAGLPGALKKASQDKRAAPFLGGLTGAQGTNHFVARTAKAILAAAREHMSNVAEEAAEEAAKLADSQHLSPSQGAASDGAIQMNS